MTQRAGKLDEPEIVAPTVEQMRRGAFELDDVTDKRKGGGTITIGKAYRHIPVFEILGRQGVFSMAELKALRTYREHADRADRSPLRDSIAMLMPVRGSGDGPTAALMRSIWIAAGCEAAAGSVRDILRAVVVDDVTLSEWAIRQAGSVEVWDEQRRKTRIRPRAKALAVAQLEIKIAAKRVRAELDA